MCLKTPFACHCGSHVEIQPVVTSTCMHLSTAFLLHIYFLYMYMYVHVCTFLIENLEGESTQLTTTFVMQVHSYTVHDLTVMLSPTTVSLASERTPHAWESRSLTYSTCCAWQKACAQTPFCDVTGSADTSPRLEATPPFQHLSSFGDQLDLLPFQTWGRYKRASLYAGRENLNALFLIR